MSFNIAVCAKQVVDPDTPLSGFQIDSSALSIIPAQGIPPVVNGYDENAVEAALKIKEQIPDTIITVISVGSNFVMDVMKKTLSMGALKRVGESCRMIKLVTSSVKLFLNVFFNQIFFESEKKV